MRRAFTIPLGVGEHGIDDEDAEARIDAAVSIISDIGWLRPVCIHVKSKTFGKYAALTETNLREECSSVLGVSPKEVWLDKQGRRF